MTLPTSDLKPIYTVTIDLTREQISQIIIDAIKEKVPYHGDAKISYTITPQYTRDDYHIGDELTGAKIMFETVNFGHPLSPN